MPDDAADFAQFTSTAMAQTAAAVETPAAAPAETPAAPEPAKTETPPEPVKAAPAPEPEEVPAWKKAAEAERQKRATKTNEVKLQTKLAAVESELAKWKAIEAKRATDPLGAAEEAGFSYDTLTKEYIKGLERNPNAPPPQSEEVRGLIQKIQQIEGIVQQQQQALEHKARVESHQTFAAEAKQVLEAKGDEFEFVKRDPQGLDLVREVRAAHYRSTATWDESGKNIVEPGEIMPIDEACKLAEKHLEKYLGHFKDAKKFAAAKPAEPAPAPKPATAPTLSQDLRQGGLAADAPHGSEVEQLLLLKSQLEAQMNAQQG